MNRLLRRIGGFARRAAPILRNVARVAAPMVAAAAGFAIVAERRAKARESANEVEVKRGDREVGDVI